MSRGRENAGSATAVSVPCEAINGILWRVKNACKEIAAAQAQYETVMNVADKRRDRKIARALDEIHVVIRYFDQKVEIQ